ncbi:MAG: ribulose bisphosphate carboxylase small subunit [Cyanobacteria bacterium QH_8_48_120]|jgi:ribulose-bisphosphate carboxylase small chain|nr:MAG: ribulose bisphosphate carboxylase small subunit [Cyanobacteria bacterium QH_1_48_107]PSO57338.1 MAG: ribulose bisphosphate carboxylase small subunit [Cyanobacteria bacterium QH_10_48_56]PSO60476.1 MAG: ribulose bisphosphate carboxylase small subunit [Cyanobacteria bacterium QH_2_48_84]PSO61245.1 MAG: ribulose bisphosphate carboxylase small subunit [Cyanobacteria bacterium QH_7_48_89]PSO68419.1 MAG: ribulose bisphosphate carboxylase small subunit [Cyanobacteria bacterium QH_6_48_35]PSO7
METLPKERHFETLSYLPPLSDAQIADQLQYILDNEYIPAIEFNDSSDPTEHYWTMWKLPLFQASTTDDILREVQECRSAYPDHYIRVIGFDNIRQCQVVGFIVHKPNENSRRSRR